MRQLLLMIACAVAISSSSAAHAAATIPEVKTLKQLRAAPLHTLADGTELRLGLSDGGEAAGPWGVLYCLVEKEPAGGTPATAPATTQRAGRERLGPLSYDVNWTGLKKLQLLERQDRMRRDSGYPIVYAGRVLLNRKDVATVSVFAPDGEPLAERKVEVKEPRPAWWVNFARPRELRRGEEPVDGFVALDEVSPAAPEFARAGGSIATTQPTATAAIANDIDLPLPGVLAADVKDDALLRLSLEPEGFVVRVNAKRRPHVAPDDMLALVGEGRAARAAILAARCAAVHETSAAPERQGYGRLRAAGFPRRFEAGRPRGATTALVPRRPRARARAACDGAVAAKSDAHERARLGMAAADQPD